MRGCSASIRQEEQVGMGGTVLVAHPILRDPNFHRSVVLLTEHNDQQGAIGVVINRPLYKTLSQVHGEFTYSTLSKVPVYWGGPVQADRLVITAWQWSEGLGIFQLHFGITPAQAEALLTSERDIEIRCFQGVSRWTQGQLEDELEQAAWLHLPLSEELVEQVDHGEALWTSLVGRVSTDLLLAALAPKNPALN